MKLNFCSTIKHALRIQFIKIIFIVLIRNATGLSFAKFRTYLIIANLSITIMFLYNTILHLLLFKLCMKNVGEQLFVYNVHTLQRVKE